MNHHQLKIFLLMLVAGAAGFKTGYAQQTVQFSQYMFNGLVVNPAYAGYKEDWTLNGSSRLQWTGIQGAPQTNTISVDGVTDDTRKNVGLGLLITNDRLGPENNTSAYFNYAYRLRLDADDTKRLSFGFAAGLVQYLINNSKFDAADDNDPVISAGSQNSTMADFRIGVYYSSPAFYIGASVFNLFPKTVSATLPFVNPVRHLYVTGGAMITLSQSIDWKPSVMIKQDFKGPVNLDATNYLLFNKKFWIGAAYSTGVVLYNKANLQNLNENNAVTAIVQFSASNYLRVGYSYDFVTSKLASSQSGSHELSLSLTFGRKRQRLVSPRYF